LISVLDLVIYPSFLNPKQIIIKREVEKETGHHHNDNISIQRYKMKNLLRILSFGQDDESHIGLSTLRKQEIKLADDKGVDPEERDVAPGWLKIAKELY
jgi:hypothetical protein